MIKNLILYNLIPAYIDPGTGAMLFTILISLIGTVQYIIRASITKLKFLSKNNNNKNNNSDYYKFVIFSDDKRYWNVFKPICEEFNNRNIDIAYLTASKDDPVFQTTYKHVKPEFIGEINKSKAFAKLNFLKADVLLSTTPGLNVYQWKRSKDVKHYVHILHAASDATLYKMFGLDYYDSVLLSGKYQKEDLRSLEKLRNLPEKSLQIIGIPYMDDMLNRLNKYNNKNINKNNITVLVAPSWGENAIFKKYGYELIDELLETGYDIIIRPHPQSFISEKSYIDDLIKKYENSKVVWNTDVDNFNVLNSADILISDYSGVIFDFALVYNKPVIYSKPDFNLDAYDAWWLDKEIWTVGALKRIGEEIKLGSLKATIDDCLNNNKYEIGRDEVRNETWFDIGNGAKNAVDYLINISEINMK